MLESSFSTQSFPEPDPAKRRRAIGKVLEECFWGDYRLEPQDVERALVEDDEPFQVFLVSRILSQSTFASARLNSLFPRERLRYLLDKVTVSGRAARRKVLVKAILFDEIPEEGGREWEWERILP